MFTGEVFDFNLALEEETEESSAVPSLSFPHLIFSKVSDRTLRIICESYLLIQQFYFAGKLHPRAVGLTSKVSQYSTT